MRQETTEVLTVESRSSVELALSKIIKDGEVGLLPYVETKGLLSVRFKRGQVTVTAGKFVGLIPLTREISINVRPKMPIGNWGRVLDRARASLQIVPDAHRLYLTTAQHSSSVLEFLLSNFLDALQPIQIGGRHKHYAQRKRVSSNPRGRMDLTGSMQECWSKGVQHTMSSSLYEQTTDTPYNRVIRAALIRLLNVVRHGGTNRSLTAKANAAYNDLPLEIGEMKAGDFTATRLALSTKILPSSRSYYYRPLEIALLVLSGRTVALDKSGSDVILDTFIVDFEAIFEQYLRNTLIGQCPSGLTVRDGNNEGKKPLYDSKPEPTAEPDIVILGNNLDRRLVLEVKYKDKPNRDDINQAITYAVSYRLKRVILVHQAKSAAHSGFREIGTIDGIAVDAYGFHLGNEDLAAEEAAFVEFVVSASTPPQPD